MASGTISFAAVHFTVAFGVACAVTGSPGLGGVLGLVEPLVNTLAFYLHEQYWQVAARHRAAG